MCLAIPARIVEMEGDRAVVLVHAGFAISTVDEQEAKETWELFSQMDALKPNP
jgi:hydrogenase maturation factor